MSTKDTHDSKGRILVVEDDASTRSALEKLLASSGYTVDLAADGLEALELASAHAPDVVVTDLNMPRMDGVELLAKLKGLDRSIPVILVTASTDVSSAVMAMRAGAEHYLLKPVDFDELLVCIERAIVRRAERAETENLRRQIEGRDGGAAFGLLGTSPSMQKIYRLARQVAPSRATVLVTGESGTGKGELARAIHGMSPRAKAPFVALHCAALAESLLESELFGHERGAFTGADKRRAGRFEQASGGTLFLDEIGEIPPQTQIKLLRVLQERTFERVGGNETVTVDVRLLAATNKDLAEQVRLGKFREDLYYRLKVVEIGMPPLRLRGGDALLLATHFVRRFAADNHKSITGFSDAARSKIGSYRWPGNVRELENAIERAVVMCEGEQIGEEDLPFQTTPAFEGALRIPGSTMAEVERFAILKTLEATEGSTTRAADILDISVRTIQYRLHEYGLAKPKGSTSTPE